MRMWVQSTTKAYALNPSVAFSIAAHAALIGGAVYGTGRRADALREELAEQVVERIYLLAPPDRRPDATPVAPRLRYAASGEGAPRAIEGRLAPRPVGEHGRSPLALEERRGADALEVEGRQASAGHDSVYSVLTVDESAVRVEGTGAPIYPIALIRARIEGSVVARYVIDTTGHPDSASLEVLSSTHADFTASVREALPRMRFSAGRISGRPVRQLVQQTFAFRIDDPVPAAADHTRATPPT